MRPLEALRPAEEHLDGDGGQLAHDWPSTAPAASASASAAGLDQSRGCASCTPQRWNASGGAAINFRRAEAKVQFWAAQDTARKNFQNLFLKFNGWY
jgi:hypothetical protein